MPFKPCALKMIDFLPFVFKKIRREREKGTTFNLTNDKRKEGKRNELYIAMKDVHSRKNFLGINPINATTCMLIDITSTIAHHSFCPMASSHYVVVNTCNNKNGKKFLVCQLKVHDSMVIFHPNRTSTLPNMWCSLSYYHNGKNATIEHLHQGLNPKYTHMVLSDHPNF
jgi:hypothetical protein